MLAMVINFMTSTVGLKIIEMQGKNRGEEEGKRRDRESERTKIANKMRSNVSLTATIIKHYFISTAQRAWHQEEVSLRVRNHKLRLHPALLAAYVSKINSKCPHHI
jgi:hypothetical protein